MALPAEIDIDRERADLVARAQAVGVDHFAQYRLCQLIDVAIAAGVDRDRLAMMLVACGVRICRQDASARRKMATDLFRRGFLLDAGMHDGTFDQVQE
jgi:hypothetical protein